MLKILIVENDRMFAKDIAFALKQYNTTISGIASTAKQAISLFDTEQPELAIIDIDLDDQSTGLEVARHINKIEKIPFIFLTEFIGSSSKYFKEVQATNPSNYIPKGNVLPNQIWHFVETAIDNFSKSQNPEITELKEMTCFIRHVFFARNKDDFKYEKVGMNDVSYLEVKKPYVKIITNNKREYLIKMSLEKVLDKFNSVKLIRIHQSYAIHIDSIDFLNLSNGEVHLVSHEILPVGRTFAHDLKSKLELFG